MLDFESRAIIDPPLPGKNLELAVNFLKNYGARGRTENPKVEQNTGRKLDQYPTQHELLRQKYDIQRDRIQTKNKL